jgi:hypothetical protein
VALSVVVIAEPVLSLNPPYGRLLQNAVWDTSVEHLVGCLFVTALHCTLWFRNLNMEALFVALWSKPFATVPPVTLCVK